MSWTTISPRVSGTVTVITAKKIGSNVHVYAGSDAGKVFDGADSLNTQFNKGDFVKIQARGNVFKQQVELVIENVRRVNPAKDAVDGFRAHEGAHVANRMFCLVRTATEGKPQEGISFVLIDSIEPRLYLLTRMIMDTARGR